jgi:hypothetical protein
MPRLFKYTAAIYLTIIGLVGVFNLCEQFSGSKTTDFASFLLARWSLIRCRIGVMAKMQKKTLSDPEEKRLFDN